MKSRIDEFMYLRRMSISELVERSGLTRKTIGKARKPGPDGIERCTLRTIGQIADALGVRPKDLIDDCPQGAGRE